MLLLSHGLDLYDSSGLGAKWDQVFRAVHGVGDGGLFSGRGGLRLRPSFCRAAFFFPGLNGAWWFWRSCFCAGEGAYSWIVQQPYFRERVYVLGTGERAQRLLNGLRQRSELGIEVVGWTGNIEGELTRETVASHLVGLAKDKGVHRVIVAMPDRRGTLPVEELLDMRLAGVKIEEATSWLEKITGRIEVEQLYPSWLIFADGFRFSSFFRHGTPGAEFFGGAGRDW